MLCLWARHFTLTVPLSTQVYKWIPVNLMLGVTLWSTSIPSRGEVEIFLVASCYRNRDKLWPGEPLGSYTDFFFLLPVLWSFPFWIFSGFFPHSSELQTIARWWRRTEATENSERKIKIGLQKSLDLSLFCKSISWRCLKVRLLYLWFIF